jgi:NAD(P)-dependent dehydrogenase (short-subunit alcohol dehydrogenase family)
MSLTSDQRVAVVTGAAGAIGSSCVQRLALADFRVIAVDAELDRLNGLSKFDGDIVPVVADVSSRSDADNVVSACSGRVDVLLNIAGVGDGLMGVDELDDERWDRVVAVNQTGAFLMTRRVVPLMLARHEGVVINMSSAAGLRGGRAGYAYTATKWALVGMAQNLAATLGPEGIRSHAICPSRIEGAETLSRGEISERGRARAQRDSGRPPAGTPADIAGIVMFLISDGARHLNGVALPVDAGWLAY